MTASALTLRLELSDGQCTLARPALNAQNEWSERRSTLVSVHEPGRAAPSGLGEATPLPGYSHESQQAARAALDALNGSVSVPANARSPLPWLDVAQNRGLPNSAQFALESALLQTWCRVNEAESQPGPEPPSAQLIAPADLESRAVLGPAVKCKLGRDLPRELQALGAFRTLHGASVSLRLDANRSLGLADVFAPALALLRPEFVEEPCPLSVLGEPRPLPFPLALDESFWLEPELAVRWLTSGHVAAVVLKPMALGLSRTLSLARLARARQVPVVLSHLFDGSVAFATYCQLYHSFGCAPHVAGLGRHEGLALWQAHASACSWVRAVPELL